MGLLINDELIWLSIPRCASVSIESSLLNSNLNIKRLPSDITYGESHMHFQKSELYNYFGIHKTICIKRDWFSKWMSSLYQLFKILENSKTYTPKVTWDNMDNEFIYRTFDDDFANNLYMNKTNYWDLNFLRLVNETELNPITYDIHGKIPPNIVGIISVLSSQKFFKENKPADYEFEITQIDNFSDFIYKKFGERLVINKLNESKKITNNIILDDTLKQWVWDKFEKPFEKRSTLI